MITKAKKEDLARLIEIYDIARAFMRENGNMNQWNADYPGIGDLPEDIEMGNLYVAKDESGRIYGCFAMIAGEDPTYGKIDGGEWMSDRPYAAIHKVASDGTTRGFFTKCTEFARRFHDHLRIDTHEDNIPMQKAITKNGFTYRGIIYLANGDPRMAYEWEK